MMGPLEENLPVIITTTPIATTLPHLAAFEFFEVDDPRITKMIVLGKDRMTVPM